jgi:sugar lactone lactonase YvrE
MSTAPLKIEVDNAVGGTPLDVAVASSSLIFVTTAERRLHRLDGALDVLQTVVLPGSGTPVALVANGLNVLVALNSGVILKYPTGLASYAQQTVTGTPVDLAVDPSGLVYVATAEGEVHKLSSGLTNLNTASFPDSLTSIRARDASNIYVAASNGTIRRLAPNLTVSNSGSIGAQPIDITSDSAGNVIVATTAGLVRISPMIVGTGSAAVSDLVGVDMDSNGRVVATTSTGHVYVYNAALTPTGNLSTDSPSARGIAFGPSTTFYLVGGGPGILWGDPHIVTVDGVAYDYQGAGEFVLVRTPAKLNDHEGPPLELQVRHGPVPTTTRPGGDAHSGLPVCVSVATAIAARVGNHRVTYQPMAPETGGAAAMQVRVDGVVTAIGETGIDLGDGGRIVATVSGIEIDFPDGSVVFVTAGWWEAQNTWYVNITLAVSGSAEGLAGPLPDGSWLPALPDGSSMGPKPEAMHDRFIALYGKFGEAWRVTDKTSLFDYGPGQSTSTYANRSWPSEEGSCTLGSATPADSLSEAIATVVCEHVKEHRAECVFDVMATGHAGFATTYSLSEVVQAQPRSGAAPVSTVSPTSGSSWLYRVVVVALLGIVVVLLVLLLRCRRRSGTSV